MNDIKISQFNIKYPDGEVRPVAIQLPISAITGLEEILTIINSSVGVAFGVFENYQALVTKLFDATVKIYASPGMPIYIGQSNVPDLWIKEVKDTSNPFTYTNEEDFINKVKSGYQFGYYILSLQEVEIPYNIFIAKPTQENFSGTGLMVYNSTTGLVSRQSTYQSVPGGSQVPITKSNGRIAVGSPIDDIDATNKDYVDTNFLKKPTATGQEVIVTYDPSDGSSDFRQIMWGTDNETKNFSVPLTDGTGCIITGTPSVALHAVNKNYVDSGFVHKFSDTSGYNRVYAEDTAGNQMAITIMYPSYSFDATGAASRNGLASYVDGNLGCAIPTNDYHAANKKYVDDGFVAKQTYSNAAGSSGTDGTYHARVYGVKYDGTEEAIPVGNQANNYSICWRDADANIYVGDPTQILHCVNKRYADTTYLAKKTGLTGEVIITQKPDGTTDNLAYSTDIANLYMVRRTINGDVLVPDMPVSPYGAVNKNYVENKINNIETSQISINSSSATDQAIVITSAALSLSQDTQNYEYKFPQDSGYLSISKMPKIRLHGIVYEDDCLSGGKILVEVLEDGLQEGDIIQICKRKRVYCAGVNRIQNYKSERVIFRQVKSAGNKYPLRTIVTSEDIEIKKRLFTIDIGDDFASDKRSNLSRQGTYCVRIRRPFYKIVPSGSSGADAGKEIEFKAIFSNEVTFRTRTYTSENNRVVDDISPFDDKLPIALV